MAAPAATSATARRTVIVRLIDGSGVTLELEAGCRARRLKSYLQAELGIPTSEIQLLCGSRLLADGEVAVPRAAGEAEGGAADSGGSSGGVATSESAAPVELAMVRTRPSKLPAFLRRVGLERAADVAFDGSTVLHLAATRGESEICLELLANSEFTALNAQDFLGNTALHSAAAHGLPEVCAGLLKHPGFTALSVANNNGHSALHLAALRGDAGTCKAILKHLPAKEGAAAREALDALGATPAELASSAGHDALARELLLMPSEPMASAAAVVPAEVAIAAA